MLTDTGALQASMLGIKVSNTWKRINLTLEKTVRLLRLHYHQPFFLILNIPFKNALAGASAITARTLISCCILLMVNPDSSNSFSSVTKGRKNSSILGGFVIPWKIATVIGGAKGISFTEISIGQNVAELLLCSGNPSIDTLSDNSAGKVVLLKENKALAFKTT